jgi:hypothetical protein
VYVVNEVRYHVSRALTADTARDELAATGWLSDMPQDCITLAAAGVLGADELGALAASAESSSDWWLAARYYSLQQCLGTTMINDLAQSMTPTVSALTAMQKLGAIPQSCPEREDLYLGLVAMLASSWDITGDLARRPQLVKQVLAMKAATRDPAKVGIIQVATRLTPALMRGDVEAIGKITLESMQFLLAASSDDPDLSTQAKCLSSA